MPANPVYNGTSWAVNPETGELQQIVDGEVTATTGSLEEVSGGALETVGSRIRETSTGYFRWNMTPDYPTTLHVSPTGFITVERAIDPTTVNAQIYSRARYGVTGQAEVILPNGEAIPVEVTGWSTRIGDRLIVKAGSEPGTEGRYAYTADVNPGGTIDPFNPPSGWAFAAPETAMDRAVIKEVLNEHDRLVSDMVALGMKDENGNEITTKYDAASYVARIMDTQPGLAAVLLS